MEAIMGGGATPRRTARGLRRRLYAVVAACVWLVCACSLPVALPGAQRPVTAAECPPADADPDGYLRTICLYLVEEGTDVAPARPNGYTIKRLEDVQSEGRTVVWVFLNCCYLGDIAVIDSATGQVIEFRVGAK